MKGWHVICPLGPVCKHSLDSGSVVIRRVLALEIHHFKLSSLSTIAGVNSIYTVHVYIVNKTSAS